MIPKSFVTEGVYLAYTTYDAKDAGSVQKHMEERKQKEWGENYPPLLMA
jgi:hypothetical protein